MKIPVIIAASLLVLPLAAKAQGFNPSADDLVRMLQPKAGGATRGIRALSTPNASPTPSAVSHVVARPAAGHPVATAPHAAAAASAPADGASASEGVNLTVEFANGSDHLTPAATHVLDELGRALSSPTLASYTFKIVGHTDMVGSTTTNQVLSQRRAQAVSEYITTHFNVAGSRLQASGVGESDPLVPTSQGVAEPRNRRVQIINAGT